MNTEKDLAIGIDLGTTNSLAARIVSGRPETFKDAHGQVLIPSCLSFGDHGELYVGTKAQERALLDPSQTIFSIKRLMGRSLQELAAEIPYIPHQLIEREVAGGRKVLRVKVADQELTPEELSAMILKEVRRVAGNAKKAVITVPAYFDDSQRQATRDAGRIAGLDVLRIINEPTAAALAYGLHEKKVGKIAVYDLGGGTFDCSILELSQNVFQVLATHGDTHLGGDDFDRCIMDLLIQELHWQTEDLDAELLQHLRAASQQAKHELSLKDETLFHLHLEHRDLDIARTITRAEFESLIAPLVKRSLESCQKALADVDLTTKDIEEVVLVGGSTRVPLVRHAVAEFFGRQPHDSLNPDEVVALGAALQADILTSGTRDMLLLDVVPLSLGIETLGGVVDKLIPRNATVPAQATARYTTYADNQTALNINIYQGERELTRDCRLLGEFKLAGIPPMPAQLAQVDVTFLVDANGMLKVSAVEKRSGQQASIEIKASHGLSEDEVEAMVLESVEHAREDFTTRRMIELKNKAQTDLRHTEKAWEELNSVLSEEQRQEILSTQEALQLALEADSLEMLQVALDQFNHATTPLAEALMNRVTKQVLAGKREESIKSLEI